MTIPLMTIPIYTMLQIILIVLLSGLAWNLSGTLVEYLKFEYIKSKLRKAIEGMETSANRVRQADQKVSQGQTCYAPSSTDIDNTTHNPDKINTEVVGEVYIGKHSREDRVILDDMNTKSDIENMIQASHKNIDLTISDLNLNLGHTQDSTGPKSNN